MDENVKHILLFVWLWKLNETGALSAPQTSPPKSPKSQVGSRMLDKMCCKTALQKRRKPAPARRACDDPEIHSRQFLPKKVPILEAEVGVLNLFSGYTKFWKRKAEICQVVFSFSAQGVKDLPGESGVTVPALRP